MGSEDYDFAVVGGGIAGAAVAAALGGQGSVVLLEAESDFGVHATGRSAAMLLQTYGSPEVQQLTAASRTALEGELAERAGRALLRPRPVLWTGKWADPLLPELRRLASTAFAPPVDWLEPDTAERIAPAVDATTIDVACLEPDAATIDVELLHRTFLRDAARRGGMLLRGKGVVGVRRLSTAWELDLGRETLTASVLVNAAGAWADGVASMAGLEGIGLEPRRRTVLIATSEPMASDTWPTVGDLGDEYYFEPAGTQVLASPADETPAQPGHVRADDLDVALCIERLHARTRLRIRRVTNTWAGLRTFAADRLPVLGPDPNDPTFLWCAGLGGFGIMTAPAVADIVADHALGRPASALAQRLMPDRQILETSKGSTDNDRVARGGQPA